MNLFKLSLIFILSLNLYSLDLKNYFNEKCSKIIDKKIYQICYDYSVKGPRYISYTLYGDKVHLKNIKKRPRFYAEKSIPKGFRVYPKDYIYVGYDRGHIAKDSDFDYSKQSLLKVYSMANITPQVPKLNQISWQKVERLESKLAVKYKKINVLNIIFYKDHSKYLKKIPIKDADKLYFKRYKKHFSKKQIKKYNEYDRKLRLKKIIIPSGFLKVLYNENFTECFYYKNEYKDGDKLKNHKVECWKYLK